MADLQQLQQQDPVLGPVYCIHVPGHDPLIFSFLSFILFDWVGVLWPQLSKVLKVVCWAGSVTGFQARSKDREILEE